MANAHKSWGKLSLRPREGATSGTSIPTSGGGGGGGGGVGVEKLGRPEPLATTGWPRGYAPSPT